MPKHRFLADECTFVQTVRFMRELGFHIERTQEFGLKGAKDADIFAQAQETQSVLVTNDKGFGNISAYPPSSHHV